MPAGQIIGRVAVRVLPNTDDFRKDAERDLSRIEKRLSITVPAKVDTNGLLRDMLAKLREINAENKVKDSRKIRFQTTISNNGMSEAIRDAVRQLQSRASTRRIQFKADVTAVLVEAELSRKSLDEVKRQIKDWQRDNSPIKVQVQPEMMPGASSIVSARLAVLSRPRTAPIVPVVNETAVAKVATALAALSGGRVVSEWFRDIADSLGRIDKSAPGIAAISLGVTGIAGYGLSAASNLAAMSASLAEIGPLALTLPGILGGIAIGLGTTAAALKDFNTVLPEVKGQLSALQDTISTNFWAGFEAPMRNLIDSLLPEFTAGLGETATQLGQWFGGLADSITGAFNPLLGGMFADLASSINIFETATPAIANIAAVLGSVGAGQLPELAQWVATITERFSNFLTAANETGALDQWIETAKTNLGDLGRVIGNIGGILAGISRAATAAGGSGLGMMADTLERVHAVVDSPAFQSGLTSVLASAHTMMSAIADGAGKQFSNLLSTLVQTFQTIAPIAGAAIGELVGMLSEAFANPALQQGIVALFEGIRVAVHELAPLMGPLSTALGSVLQVVGALLPVIAQLVVTAFVPLAKVITDLTPALLPLIEQLGGILLMAVQALAPVIAAVGKALGEVLVAAGPLLEAFGKLVAFIMPILVPVLTFLIGILADTLVMAINGVVNVFNGATKVIAGILGAFKALFTGNWTALWQSVKQIASGVWDLIVGALQLFFSVGILGAVSKGFLALKGLWSGGWNAVKTLALDLWASLKGRFSTFMDDLAALPGAALFAIKKLFKGVWDDITTAVSLALGELKSTVTTKLGQVVAKVGELPGAALEALGDLGGTLRGVGMKLIQGLIDGIASMFGKVQGKLGELTGKLTDWKGPESLDRVLLVGAGQLIIDGLINGLESRYDAVRKSLRGLTADIGSTVVQAPEIGQVGGMSSAVTAALSGNPGEGAVVRVLNYHAAPGSSLDSEEELFTAANRSRMVGW